MLSLYSYSFPYTSTFKTSFGTFSTRKGVYIRYIEPDTPIDLVSEAAPFPGLFDETFKDVLLQLKSDILILTDFLEQVDDPKMLKDFLDKRSYPSSMEFAISCLALDLITYRDPSQNTIKAISHKQSSQITVNSVSGILPDRDIENVIEEQYQLGYRTLKLKCGRNPGNLSLIIRKYSDRHPDLKFRIDANRSWTFDEALKHLKIFHLPSVEYCEEPLLSGNRNEYLKLKELSPVPLALDESVRNIHQLRQAIKYNQSEIVIIKPAVFGNILNLIETFTGSDTHVIKSVFSSCFESAVGLQAVVRLTALLGNPEIAHGLDTGRFLKQNFSGITVRKGMINTKNLDTWSAKFDITNAKFLKKIDAE